MNSISATPVGRATAASGLRPATVAFLIGYLSDKAQVLSGFLPDGTSPGRLDDFYFLLMNACLASPEFEMRARGGTRFIPYPLENLISNPRAVTLDGLLASTPWQSDLPSVNGAMVALRWVNGDPISDLEKLFPNFSAGMLRGLCRDIAWIVSGVAGVLEVAASPLAPDEGRPLALQAKPEVVRDLFRLPRLLRRLARRLEVGLPDDVLWMSDLQDPTGSFRLRRREILALRAAGISTPLAAMDNDLDSKRAAAFQGVQPSPLAKNNWFKQAARDWKSSQRKKAAERHEQRAKNCPQIELLRDYYLHRGSEFEATFEKGLIFLGIAFEKLDDGKKKMAPDYLLKIGNFDPIVVELKSRMGDGLVTLNAATEVIAAAAIHGHKEKFCVTLCHPGYDPSVPSAIVGCGQLSVVESADLAEALLRLCEKKITPEHLYRWLTAPGPALPGDLPYGH